ncbi:hypothetical protein [Ravibacter arvi]|uniref:hypothetical protein n=1 Tax=Ravibacter arvi TaxID=2051041 RepID=UPI0031E7B9D6
MVAHLPDGHPEWNAVELKDLLVLKKKSSERDWVRGKGDPSAAVGMTLRLVGAASNLLLSMVAHLPDGHPEWNTVELKDLLVLKKKSSERDWVRGKGDPSAAVGMTRGLERRQTCGCQW